MDWETPAVTNVMVETLAPGADEVPQRILGEFLRRSASGAAVNGFFTAHLEIDTSAEARQISIPTLVIHGRDDSAIRIEAGRTLAALIPGVRFEVVEGGHLEGVGNTPEVRARILSFFDEEPSPTAAGSSTGSPGDS
jgi:pimeloyl-ACP methyl ester carboxylesterase